MAVSTPPIAAHEKSSGFQVGEKVLKANQKDILRTVKMSFQWLQTAFEGLDICEPINNLITFVKGGEDALCFGEFSQSICKLGHSVTKDLSKGFTNAITSLCRSILDLSWNFFKVCKSLKYYAIVSFGSAFFVNLMAFGGLSFATSSADRALQGTKKILELESSQNVEKKDAKILVQLYKLAKNIGTFAIGIIVTLRALIGFTAPGLLMLLLGTTILVSNISASIVQETYHLPKK